MPSFKLQLCTHTSQLPRLHWCGCGGLLTKAGATRSECTSTIPLRMSAPAGDTSAWCSCLCATGIRGQAHAVIGLTQHMLYWLHGGLLCLLQGVGLCTNSKTAATRVSAKRLGFAHELPLAQRHDSVTAMNATISRNIHLIHTGVVRVPHA